MKKYVYVFLIILICMMLQFFTSCENKKEENNMNAMFFDGYVMDDTKVLDSNLTTEYDLNELKKFFKHANTNESIVLGSNMPVMTFSEVNNRYLVEIVRTGGYSVYKVIQGGYFYVFWVKPFNVNANTDKGSGEPSVYFSAYLASDASATLFDSLIPGVSTAEDVRKIDPSFELSFLRSNGIFSYSYIDEETILQIEYIYQENINGYDDLIVKEKMIIPRTSAPSRYSVILSSDLP